MPRIFVTLLFILLRYADQLTDLVNEMVKVRHETDEAKKKELEEKVKNEILPTHLKLIETKLAQGSSGFLVDSGLTWIDLYLHVILEWLSDKKEAVLAHFPKIKASEEKVRTHPKIAEWIAKRPVTEM